MGYRDETVATALAAIDAGVPRPEAAALVGVTERTIYRWLAKRRRVTVGCCKIAPETAREAEEAAMKDENGREMAPAEIENVLLRAVLADLKAEGWAPASISNRRKTELGERLRLATGLPLRCITDFLRISKSSYEYHRARLGRDKYAELRDDVRELFEDGGRNWGYRTIWARLRARGTRVSEKVVRRLMREEGLEVVYVRRKPAKWSSYEGETSHAPDNLVRRKFRAGAPDELWLTDITEFALPDAHKVYLSPVIDCFDGKPVSWAIDEHPTKELADRSLLGAVAQMRRGATPMVHSDRGGHYRTDSWIAICEENGLVRSMSKKACSPDNSACEGFFGRLKNEFFYYRDWRGVSSAEFMGRLDAYLRYYCAGRIKRSLGWMSPDDYRRSLGYGV